MRREKAIASVEHLKRYTTLGMGTDQGKTSNLLGLALLAEATGRSIADVGTTTFRPPYTPVTMGAFPGHDAERTSSPRDIRRCTTGTSRMAPASSTPASGSDRIPIRAEANRRMTPAAREAKNVRTNAGVVDVSTLGKIELQGKDVAEFLNRVYINRWDTLAVGRCRYGVMLREDGMVVTTTARRAPRPHALSA